MCHVPEIAHSWITKAAIYSVYSWVKGRLYRINLNQLCGWNLTLTWFSWFHPLHHACFCGFTSRYIRILPRAKRAHRKSLICMDTGTTLFLCIYLFFCVTAVRANSKRFAKLWVAWSQTWSYLRSTIWLSTTPLNIRFWIVDIGEMHILVAVND